MRRLWLYVIPPSPFLSVILFFSTLCSISHSQQRYEATFHLGSNEVPANDDLLIWLDREHPQDLPLYSPTVTSVRLMNTHPNESIELYNGEIIANKVDLMFIMEESWPLLLSPGESTSFPVVVIPRISPSEEKSSDLNFSAKLTTFQVVLDTSRGTIGSEWFRWKKQSTMNTIPEIDEISMNESRYPLYLRYPYMNSKELRLLEVYPSDPSWMEIEMFKALNGGPLPLGFGKTPIANVVLHWDRLPENQKARVDGRELVVGYIHIRTTKDVIIVPLEIPQDSASFENKKPFDRASHSINAIPTKADFGIIFSDEPDATNQAINITLVNQSPTLSIEVTQIDLIPSNQPQQPLWSSGVSSGVRIPPKQRVSPALILKCSTIVHADLSSSSGEKKLNGVIRVYAQLSNSESMILDIPYSVVILAGNFTAKNTSFPFIIDNSTTSLKPVQIPISSKRFVLNNTFAIPLKIERTTITECPIHPLTLNQSLVFPLNFPSETDISFTLNYPSICRDCKHLFFECIWNIYTDIKHFKIPLKFYNQPLLIQSRGLHEKLYKKNKLKFDIGPVFRDEVHRHEIFITNLNPDEVIPIKLEGSVGNIDIDVGRIPCNITEMLPLSNRTSGLRDDMQQFVTLPYCTDLKLHEGYVWKDSYQASSWVSFYRNDYIPFSDNATKKESSMLDRIIGRRSEPTKEWKIPPGGTLRLDLYIKAKEHPNNADVLMERVAGLKLVSERTDQYMDMIAKYQSLGGKLKVSTGDTMLDMVVRPTVTANGTMESNGTEIFLHSSFSKTVFIEELSVCHPWFTIRSLSSLPSTPVPPNATSLEPIASIHSSVSCSKPNFYSCVLEWLTHTNINSASCIDTEKNHKASSTHTTELVALLTEINDFISYKYINDQSELNSSNHIRRRSEDRKLSYLNSTIVRTYDRLETVWEEFSSRGFNRVDAQLQAHARIFTDKSKDEDVEVHLPVSSSKISMNLTVPKLHNSHHLVFPITKIGSVSHAFIKVKNPTSSYIKVKLGVEDLFSSFYKYSSSLLNTSDVVRFVPYVQSSPSTITQGGLSPWWSGGNFYLCDDHGHLIQSHHNVTIRSSGGAHVSLVNPSLHASSAFLMGCGKRCGLRQEQGMGPGSSQTPDGPPSNNPFFQFEKTNNPIGASSAIGSHIRGHTVGRTIHPSFAITESSLKEEVVLNPNGEAILGPIFFRPMGKEEFESEIYLENSLTGLEKITVSGKGAFEKLVFLENPDDPSSYIEYRKGHPTLLFDGSASPEAKGPIQKSVLVVNDGDIPIHINNVYLGTDDISYFSNLKPHPFQHNQQMKKLCNSKGFHLVGCTASPSKAKNNELSIYDIFRTIMNYLQSIILYPFTYFFQSDLSIVNHEYAKLDDLIYDLPEDELVSDDLKALSKEEKYNTTMANGQKEESIEENLQGGFYLAPGQSETLYIDHYADCVQRTSFASLTLEFGNMIRTNNPDVDRRAARVLPPPSRRQKEFRRRKVELLIGYDIPPGKMKHCVPSISSPKLFYRFLEWDWSLKLVALSFIIYILFWVICKSRKVPLCVSALSSDHEPSFTKDDDVSVDIEGEIATICVNQHCFASFRFFFKSEPQTSADLYLLAKEQTKQLLMGFKKLRIYSPHCIHSNGEFIRENTNNYSNTASNGEIRHIDEAIFGNSRQVPSSCLLPIGLGWRAAVRLQTIPPPANDDSADFYPASILGENSEVHRLLLRRSLNPISTVAEDTVFSSPSDPQEMATSTSDVDDYTDYDDEDDNDIDDDETDDDNDLDMDDIYEDSQKILHKTGNVINGGYFDESKSKTRASHPKPLHQSRDRTKLATGDKNNARKSKPSANNGKVVTADDYIMTSKSRKSASDGNHSGVSSKYKAVPIQQQTSTKIVTASTLYQPRTTPKNKVPITSYRQAILGHAYQKSEDKKVNPSPTTPSGYNIDPLQLSISNNRSNKSRQRAKDKRKDKTNTRPISPHNLSPNTSSVNEEENISTSSPIVSPSLYVDASSFSPSSDRSFDYLDMSHSSAVNIESDRPKGQIPFHRSAPQASPALDKDAYFRPPPGLIPPPGLSAPPGFSTFIGGSPLLSSSAPDMAKDESLPSPDNHVRANSIVGGRPLVESVSSPFPTPPLFDYNDAVKTSQGLSDSMKALNGDDSLALPLVADAVPLFQSKIPISSPEYTLSTAGHSSSDNPLAEFASYSFLYSQQAENSSTKNASLAVGSNLKGNSTLLGTTVESTGISLSSGLWSNDNDLRLFSSSNTKPNVSDGFNIEHFLDGILNENSMMDEEEDDDVVVATAIATATGPSTTWTHGNNGTTSDSARQESRAFAYGINVTNPFAENKDSDFYEKDVFFESNQVSMTTDDDSK